jgi:hypothetical protein
VTDLADVVRQLVQDHRFKGEPDLPAAGGVAQLPPDPSDWTNSISYTDLPASSSVSVVGEGWVRFVVRSPGQPDRVTHKHLRLAVGETASQPPGLDVLAHRQLVRILAGNTGSAPSDLVERLLRWSREWHLADRNQIAREAADVRSQLADAQDELARVRDHNGILQETREGYQQTVGQLLTQWQLCTPAGRRIRTVPCGNIPTVWIPDEDGHYHPRTDDAPQ